MELTLEQIKEKLKEIKAKGWIGVLPEDFRSDDGNCRSNS